VISLLSFVVGYVYFSRFQKVDVELMPPEFMFCGTTITKHDAEYVKIKNWLIENKMDGQLIGMLLLLVCCTHILLIQLLYFQQEFMSGIKRITDIQG
jgi:hypothetical protein